MHTEFFYKEQELIRAAQEHLDENDFDQETHKVFSDLVAGFRKELRQTRRLLSLGDRMQAQLNDLNRKVAAKEARYRTIFANASEGIFRATTQGDIAEANPAMAAIFGYQSPDDFLRHTQSIGQLFQQKGDRKIYDTLLCEKGGVQRFEAAMRKADGSTVWAQLSTQALDDVDGEYCGASHVGVVLDVTQQREMLAELAHIANTDELTGLCNRRNFMELARRELRRAKRTGQPLSLIMVDVDLFKRVNDTWGHDAGDEVLRTLASVMRSALREVDICARIGGEEFVVLLPETNRKYARQAAERLRKKTETTCIDHGSECINITISLGLTTWHPSQKIDSADTDHLDSLLKSGDIALYAAKKNGRNRLETYPGTLKSNGEQDQMEQRT